mgnify:CR=1 FL=1
MDKVIDMQGGVAKPPEKGAGKSQICVCACTYQRPEGLAALLEGVAQQRFSSLPRPSIHIVIADNEGSAEARVICERFRERSGIPLTYVHEPQRGISHARNACLDNIPPECEFFAFIDDDEVPEPDWLERLVEAQQATSADVVQGPAVPAFCREAPEWLVNGDFFGWPRRNWRGTRTQLEEHQELPEAYTNNVLVRRSCVSDIGLRFDPAFALAGSEDAAFFRALHASGARIVYAPRAVVTELVPPERATLWYRLKLEYRIGISPLSVNLKKSKTKKPLRRLTYAWRDSGLGKIVWGLAGLPLAVLIGRTRMDGTTVCLLRIAFGAGQCARRLGLTYYIYR